MALNGFCMLMIPTYLSGLQTFILNFVFNIPARIFTGDLGLNHLTCPSRSFQQLFFLQSLQNPRSPLWFLLSFSHSNPQQGFTTHPQSVLSDTSISIPLVQVTLSFTSFWVSSLLLLPPSSNFHHHNLSIHLPKDLFITKEVILLSNIKCSTDFPSQFNPLLFHSLLGKWPYDLSIQHSTFETERECC
jgi:hypothetical protein